MIPFFFQSRNERLQEALGCCERGDIQRLRQIGHDFKGASASYGFIDLSQMGAELEQISDTERARVLVREMLAHLKTVEVVYV